MVGATQLDPMIIGGLSHPDELSPDEGSSLPEPNMPAVLDIVGGLFKRQILNSPKNIEITDRRSWVAFVSKTINSNFLSCLEGNGIRKKPSCLLKAVQNLVFAPDKDQVHRVCICPRLCVLFLESP